MPATKERKLRRRRIDIYESVGVQHADPYRRQLAVFQADFVRASIGLADEAKESLEGGATLLGCTRAEPTVRRYLRVIRAIASIAQSEARASSANYNMIRINGHARQRAQRNNHLF